MSAQETVAWAAAASTAPRTRWRGLRTLLRDRAAVLGLVILAVFVLGAVLAPVIAHADPNALDPTNTLAPPSTTHPLGTDELGRDEFARILYGARMSMGMAAVAAAISAVLGMTLGLLAGFYGGALDMVIMRVVDGLQALPGLLLAFAVAGLLGAGLFNIVVAVVAVWWTGYARVVRSMVLSVRERQFIDASRGVGGSDRWLIFRHIMPNVIGPAVVLATIELAHVLLALAALSYLGLGVRPPTAEWGTMMSESREVFDHAAQLLIYPGAAITLVALACNLVGDGLRDALDPRLQRDVLR